MKDWKKIAETTILGTPEMERLVESLDGLEAAFRPLVKKIPHDVEPAVIFQAAPPEAQ